LAISAIIALGLLYPTQSEASPLFTLEEANAFTSFSLWTLRYSKSYLSEEERSFRFKRYLDNFKIVKEHNAKYARGEETYDMELNEFADLDNQEFSAKYLGLKKNVGLTTKCTGSVKHVASPPASWDWADHGAVGKVANQGNCGSCWAFSTVGALEGLAFIEKGKLLSLSQQQLVDCSSKK